MNTYDRDTKCCNNIDNMTIPTKRQGEFPDSMIGKPDTPQMNHHTIHEIIQENSDLINEIVVNVDRLQRNLLGVGGSSDNAKFPNNFTCLYDEVTNQNSELKAIIAVLNFIKDGLLG